MCALHDGQPAGIDWLEVDVVVTVAPSAIEPDGFVELGAFSRDCEESGTD
jgi:hypothetical protein